MTMQMHTLSKLVSKTLIKCINLLPSMPVRRDWCIFLRTALWSEFCKNFPKLQIHAKDISVFFFLFSGIFKYNESDLAISIDLKKNHPEISCSGCFCKIASFRHPKCKKKILLIIKVNQKVLMLISWFFEQFLTTETLAISIFFSDYY